MRSQAPQNIMDPPGSSLLTARDRADAVARARRNRMTQVEAREAAREKLRAGWYVEEIHKGINKLEQGDQLSARAINAIKARQDSLFRLLDRVLPPLKAVEINHDPEGNQDVTRMTTAELLSLIKEQMPPLEGEFKVEQREPTSVQEPQPEAPAPTWRTRGDHWPFG